MVAPFRSATLLIWGMSVYLVLPKSKAADFLLTGVVVDDSGRPVSDASIDHVGQPAALRSLPAPSQPQVERLRSLPDGSFKVTVASPAIVVRKGGYVSQRILVSHDADARVVLHRIEPAPACTLKIPPLKTRDASDADYTATWTYVETRDGPKGIISGHGPLYSIGAPSDTDVWNSLEYFEVVYEDGVLDARGRTRNGEHWRLQTALGAAAQYYGMDRATAQVLDCILDRNRLINAR